MADLFVSYKAEDRPRVARLVEAIEAEGIPVWWDAHIGAGDEWRDAILRELEAARCVLVIWSRRSIGPDGHFVRDEATRALRRHVYLPVLIDRVEPPLGFGETQAIDLSSWSGDPSDKRFRSALAAIRGRLGLHDTAPIRTRAQPRISRRAAMAGGAVVVASAAGLAGWHFLGKGGGAADGIAVLPFANLSGDPAQAYFSDGIAEELRTSLSRIAGLKVVARTSSEAVRDADAKTAAAKLGVANILTGSVRRSPAMIRISAQLVDGRKGMERWSATYDRPVGDALQIQTDIANTVAEALSIQLGGDDRRRLAEGGTSNAAAHDLLLQAEAFYTHNEGPDVLQRTIGMVDSALALDPNYADAVAAKANFLMIQAGSAARTADESHKTYALAAATARRAIQLAPRSPDGYGILATILDQQFHRRAALTQFQKMRSLSGSNMKNPYGYANFLSEIGRREEAMRVADEALAADPLNPIPYSMKVSILTDARRYQEALALTERSIARWPERKRPRAQHAYLQMLLGRNDQAKAEFDKIDVGSNYIWWTWTAALAARRGDMAESERILTQVRSESRDAGYYQVAEILAQQGKKQEAIDTLELAYQARDSGLTTILVDPLMDPLRSEPRFQALFKRLDFPK
jgi:serine/threonine-protein kinase